MGYIGNQPFLGTVTGDVVVDGTVGTADLTDGAVTAAKLATTAIVDKLGYTPLSTSGTGATGTWDISISGNAATATTATNVSGGTASVTTLEATTVDATNVEVTNVKAKDGTAAIAIADSTGAVTVSTPTVVSVNSSSTALRITQTGTGNALLVEDASGDASPFVVDSTGFVLAGYTANVDSAQIQTFNGSQTNFRWNAASTGPSSNFKKSRSPTVNSYSIVGNGDRLGTLRWFGDDGAAFVEAASVQTEVDGTPGTNDMPGRLVFSTTADGSATPTERMRIDSSGKVGIGVTPTVNLDVKNAGGNCTISAQYGTGTKGQLIAASNEVQLKAFNGTNDVLTFATGASERMRIDSSGNVGIGTASPAAKLDVTDTNCIVYSRGTSGYGAFYARGSGTNSSYLFMGNATSGEQGRITCENGGAIAFGNTASATERMRILSDGSVTIGSSISYGGLLSINRAQSGGIADLLTLRDGSAGTTFNLQTYGDPAAGTANRFNYDGAYLAFRRGTTEQMRISSGGNVGIATNPSSNVRFDVYGATSSSGSYTVAFRNSSATNLFYIEDHGTIFTGNAANSPYNLTTGNAANLYTDSGGALYRSTSSLRYKSDITDATHGLSDVLKLRSVTYKAKNSGDTVFGGLIAEEVHDAGLTEFVAYDKEGRPDALHYGNMVALLVKAIQELKSELDALKAQYGN